MKYALATISLLVSLSAGAQSVVDPMRPPGLGLVEGTPLKESGPVVQMIVIGPERRYAVINGTTVMPGDRIGDARVLRIAETEVTLRGASGDAVLQLLPDVNKKIATSKAAATGKTTTANETVAQTKGEKGKE